MKITKEFRAGLGRKVLIASLSIAALGSAIGSNAQNVAYIPVWADAYRAPTPTLDQSYIAVIDTDNGTLVDSIDLPEGTRPYMIENDGRRVWTSAGLKIYEIDSSSNTITRVIDTPTSVWRMELNASATELWYISRNSNKVNVIDLDSGLVTHSITVNDGTSALDRRPASNEMYSGSWHDPVTVIDMDTKSILYTFGTHQGPEEILFSPDGNSVTVSGYDLKHYDLSGGTPVLLSEVPYTALDNWSYESAITKDGSKIINPTWGSAHIRDASDLSLLDTFPLNAYYGGVATGPNGRYLISPGDYPNVNNGQLFIVDENTNEVLHELYLGGYVMFLDNPFLTQFGPVVVDTDGDGVADEEDAFPMDPAESVDTDGDGVGDNSDAFPADPAESVDTDGDGIGDNSDAFPADPAESVDTDGDGVGDDADLIDSSILTPTVIIQGTDSGVANTVNSSGISLADLILYADFNCGEDAKNHGSYVSCMAKYLNTLKKSGIITDEEKKALQKAAAQSEVGKIDKKSKKSKKTGK